MCLHHRSTGGEAAATPATPPAAGSTGTAGSSGTTADPRRWWILALLSAAQFMLIIDITVVNVALPSIARDLALDRTQLTWIVTSYTLLFGSLLVFGGRLADAFGRRRMFLIGLSLFVLASLGSGLAPDGRVLVVARALQGVAAAILSPAAMSLVTTTFEGSERNRALAVWAALSGVGAAVGVILGGVLASGPGWQWIFFINVPVGALGAIGVGRLVKVVEPPRPATGLDLPGAAALTLGIGGLLWAIIDAGDSGWASVETLARVALATVLLGAFVHRERTTARPLVRLEMLADRTFAGAVGLMLAGSMVLGGMVFLGTLYLQLREGLSPIDTGLVFLPMALALVAGSQWAAMVIGHHGQRASATIGFAAAGLGMLYLGRLPGSGNPLADVLPGLVLAGFGIAAVFVSATTTAFGRIDEAEAGRASGFVSTSHELGLALGSAVASTIGGGALTGLAQSGAGFGGAFMVGVAVAVAGLVIARVAMPSRPHASGRPMFAH